MSDSVQDILKNIVVYIKVNGKVQGTGFFINEFGTVLTCYHIFSQVSNIQNLEAINKDKIEIEFHNKSYNAVAIHSTHDPLNLDVIFLKVDIPLNLIYLSDLKNYDNTQSLVTCGYRTEELDVHRCNGLVHIEHSEDINQEGFIILDDSQSHHKIIKGLSGSPLLEASSRAIVGMIVGRFNDNFEEYDEAIAIPLSKVATIFDPLRMKIEQYQKYLTLEHLFIKDKFLSSRKREELSQAFCKRFLKHHCQIESCGDFQEILAHIKKENLIDLFIEWIPFWIDQEFKRSLSIKQFYFENREKHFGDIVSDKEGPTFISIDGALSCGKTHMMMKLKERFEQESWLCYSIQCSKSPSTTEEIAISIRHTLPINNLTSNDMSGYALGNYILQTKEMIQNSFEKDIKGIVLLFDDVDRVTEEHEFEKFLRLIREINSILLESNIHSKTVIAGNNLSEIIEDFDYSFDFVKKKKKIVLEPFKYKHVQKFIEKTSNEAIQKIEMVTARFFYLTNGHPGIMSYIVENEILHLENLAKKLYWKNLNLELINQKVEHIVSHIVKNIEFSDIFNRLAYFRHFNDDILGRVYNKWFASDYKFKRPIRKISESKIVFSPDLNTKTTNKAIRSIFLLHGRQQEHFLDDLQEAQDIYKVALEELLGSYPKETQVPINTNKIALYLQEELFLELNLLYFRHKKDKKLVPIEMVLEKFENRINYLINEIVQIKPQEYKRPIEEVLSKLKQGFQNREFKFHVCFFSTEEFDTQPYRMLMRRVVAFEEEIAEEGRL